VGANTWESAGAPAAPAGTAALRHATIVLPDAEERARVISRVEQSGREIRDFDGVPAVSDPSGTTLVLATA
jgi:catechol 2,3-dioxygenase